MSEFSLGKPSSGIKDQMDLPGMNPKKELPQEKIVTPEPEEEKQFFKDTVYITGDTKDRDGTTVDSPLSQDKNGEWWLGGEKVPPAYVLFIASRELPDDVFAKLKKLCDKK